jgi:hypothetical protein
MFFAFCVLTASELAKAIICEMIRLANFAAGLADPLVH